MLNRTDPDPEMTLRVRSEIEPELVMNSTLARETEFVHSHTVHHYALIAAKLKSVGIEVPDEFGVAPSTLRYWATLKTSVKGVS